jgi:hypothetical protein
MNPTGWRQRRQCANRSCTNLITAIALKRRLATQYCSRLCANTDPPKRGRAAATMRDRIATGGWTWEAALRQAQRRPDVRARMAASIRLRQRKRVAQGLWRSPSQRPEVAAKISAARRRQERADTGQPVKGPAGGAELGTGTDSKVATLAPRLPATTSQGLKAGVTT